MIELKNVSKYYGNIAAVDNISLIIKEGSVMGLLGTNGAGKSTLLRSMAGVLKPEQGEILINGETVWNNPKAKSLFFYISDDQYYFPNSTPKELGAFYKTYYPSFDTERFYMLLDRIDLPANRKIRTFSKGMKKQLSILLGICAGTQYLFCDETFDGLDPVIRNTIKKIIAKQMEEYDTTIVMTSHNLRELEDICDNLGLLYKGGILFESDIDAIKTNMYKVQISLKNDFSEKSFKDIEIMNFKKVGSVATIIINDKNGVAKKKLEKLNPVILDFLPLTLEEVFIYEMEALGYEFNANF